MTAFDQDIVIVGTVADWPTVQANCAAAGYSLSDGLPLSADGTAPATHRGTATRMTQAQAAMLAGEPVTVSVNPPTEERGEEHFNLVLSNMSLLPISDVTI